MTQLPFIPVAEPDIGVAEEAAVVSAIRSGWISSIGAYITEFERNFAAFSETKHAVCVSNGTVALHLLLVSAGIGQGDEVIVPSLTFVATAAAVRHAGAIPVFADCDPVTGTINAEAVGKAASSRTKAIIAVHLYGNPADMGSLREIADEHGLLLFEDAAEAHGAKYRGKTVGGLGDAATFSFYGNKIITTGEGGMVVTNDEKLLARLRFLRDHAMDPQRRYWHPEVGYNYRMTNMQAAMGVAQLERFEEITKKRQVVLDQYRESALTEKFGILFNPCGKETIPVPWLVSAVFPRELAKKLPAICQGLRARNIDSRPYFRPLHQMPPYSAFRRMAANGSGDLTETEELASRGINLPSSGNLSVENVQRVISEMEAILQTI